MAPLLPSVLEFSNFPPVPGHKCTPDPLVVTTLLLLVVVGHQCPPLVDILGDQLAPHPLEWDLDLDLELEWDLDLEWVLDLEWDLSNSSQDLG